jgi:hypothetical protein
LEKTEYKGSWFVPEKPDAVIPGVLHFENSGRITLDLQGTLTDPKGTRPQSLPLILGKSTEGAIITLYGCIQTNTSAGIEGVRETSFHIVGVLIGAHFGSPESIGFGRLSATFPQLDWWVGSSGVKVELPDKETIAITKQSSYLESANLPGMRLSIGFSFTEHFGRDEVSVKPVPFVSIDLTTEIQLKKLLDLLYHLCNFFALAASQPVYPDLIDVFTETAKVTLGDGKSFRRPIKIVYGGVNYGVPLDAVNMRGMLFELSSVRSKFANLLEKWFEKRALLEPVFDLYFGTLYNTQMFLQQKFLSLVQGVESYHRRVFDGYESSPEQHKKRLQDIIKATPNEHKSWLQDKLSDSNDLSLKRRLEELVIKYSFLGFEAEFVDNVRNARNYLTHFDENKKEYAEPDKLFTHSRKLRALTESILLTELGLTLAEVEAMMVPIEKRRAEEFRIYDF